MMTLNDALLVKRAAFERVDEKTRVYLVRKGYASDKGGFHVLVPAAEASAQKLRKPERRS